MTRSEEFELRHWLILVPTVLRFGTRGLKKLDKMQQEVLNLPPDSMMCSNGIPSSRLKNTLGSFPTKRWQPFGILGVSHQAGDAGLPNGRILGQVWSLATLQSLFL